MVGRWVARLAVGALLCACGVAACTGSGGSRSSEDTASTVAALGSAPPQLQLEVRTPVCGKARVEDVLEITNTGATPVPLAAISIELWADDTSGHRLEPSVLDPGHIEGDRSCARDVFGVHAAAESFSPACGPDPQHQANWQVTISNGDGAVLAPGATWKDIDVAIALDHHGDFSPGTADWYSSCEGPSYQHTSGYALYVGGKLATSSTGIPPSCKAPHGTQQLTGQVAADGLPCTTVWPSSENFAPAMRLA